MSQSAVKSPCVRNCCLDLDDICLGCGRHLTEITGWQSANDETKLKILDVSRQRLLTTQKH